MRIQDRLFVHYTLAVFVNRFHRIQNDCGAHPASYPMGSGGSFPGVKRAGREAEHSPPSSAEIKNAWIYTSIPQYAFMAWCLVKHRNNLTFTL
jgi:hypothetical protein